MALPVSQDTRSKYMVFVEKINQNVYRMYNGSGAAVNQGDYMYINGLFGVVLQDAANTEYFDFKVDDEIEIHADDLTTGANTFGTLYQNVYFNAADASFADDPAYGLLVGLLSQVKDSDGMIKFFNMKKNPGLPGELIQFEIDVDADATSGKEINLGVDFKLLDVVLYCTATSGSGTAKLTDGTNDITNAITCAVVDTRGVPATIDETYAEITAASETLTVVTNGAADRCRLLLTVKAV